VDNNEGQKFITSKLKTLSGGDDITARRQLKFKAGKLLIQTNIMPTFSGKNTDNTALKERVEILEFPFSYVDNDDLQSSQVQEARQQCEGFISDSCVWIGNV